jgi:hypothetical protein
MRTAKKIAKSNIKTKAKAALKAAAKAKPKVAAKLKAVAKWIKAPSKTKAKTAPKTKAKAAPKIKAKMAPKTKAKTKVRPEVKAAPKTRARLASPARKPPLRRDGSGRLDPKYARDLRALSRENHVEGDDRAFFKTPRSGDDLAEELGEEAVGTMTSGEDQGRHLIDEEVEEERGGPFVRTGGEEFARGTDGSNPLDATREPFPRT